MFLVFLGQPGQPAPGPGGPTLPTHVNFRFGRLPKIGHFLKTWLYDFGYFLAHGVGDHFGLAGLGWLGWACWVGWAGLAGLGGGWPDWPRNTKNTGVFLIFF